MNNLPREGERVLFVTFVDAKLKPFSLFTVGGNGCHHCYDVEYSRAERSLVASDVGNARPYLDRLRIHWWAAADLDLSAVKVYGDKTGKPTGQHPSPKFRVAGDAVVGGFPCSARERFKVEDLARHIQFFEGSLVHCYFCNDYFDGAWGPDRPCRHVTWCSECHMWSTPSERCDHDKRKEVK